MDRPARDIWGNENRIGRDSALSAQIRPPVFPGSSKITWREAHVRYVTIACQYGTKAHPPTRGFKRQVLVDRITKQAKWFAFAQHP